ncbi:integrase [Neorhizobium sp. 2083]|uniref:DUF6538 domain-containing protein n=1 Tax=Neorhizobium sp. 2083 TaxID=2817762 RepID=UPI00285CEE5B|nr:DUF6538 domain-containing protein [Neorhizobium sp. 2083]MDR6819570.1 integrase [Neorhizobium sp. 2083]
MTKNHIVRRKSGNYSFRIAIPEVHRHRFEGKREIWETLNTTSRTVANASAAQRVLQYKTLFLTYDVASDTPMSSKDSAEKAALLGFEHYTAQEIQNASTKDKVLMLNASHKLLDRLAVPTRQEIALIGGVVEDSLSLDDLFKRYQELAAGKWNDLDHRAHQKKWNRYLEPIKDFKREMGDLDVLTITTKTVGDYVVNLSKRVADRNVRFTSETANKKLLFLNAMVAKVFKTDFPKRENPFEDAKVEHRGNDKEKRQPFTETEIIALHEKMEESQANDELKAVLTLMEYTGAIASEIVYLHESDIHLDEEIPFIHIGPNPNRKSLKTENRPRDIPLVGPALEVAKAFRHGFPRYCRSNGSEALSAVANKQIKQVAPDKTTYSFRHRFIDWLREVDGMQDSWLQSIVGHDGSITAKYGKGYSMRKKLDAIEKAIALVKEKQESITSKRN